MHLKSYKWGTTGAFLKDSALVLGDLPGVHFGDQAGLEFMILCLCLLIWDYLLSTPDAEIFLFKQHIWMNKQILKILK